MTDWLLVVPVICRPELVARCFDTVDDPSRLVVVDNSPDGIGARAAPAGATVVSKGRNLGVAASWNVGLDMGAELTVIASAAVAVDGGYSRAAAQLAAAGPWGGVSQHHWHLAAVTRAAVDRFGRFDENYHPAYFEDTDWLQRLTVAGEPFPTVHVDGADLGAEAHGTTSGVLIRYDLLEGYHAAKWGGVPGRHGMPAREHHTTPFDTGRPLSWWPDAPPRGVFDLPWLGPWVQPDPGRPRPRCARCGAVTGLRLDEEMLWQAIADPRVCPRRGCRQGRVLP